MGVEPLTLVAGSIVGTTDDELTALFTEHYRSLLGVARVLLDEPGNAEEVVQEAFVRLQTSPRRLREPERVGAYLRSTVLNLARGRLRRRLVALRHQPSPLPPAPPAEDAAVADDDRRLVLLALRALPRRQRECLTLRYYLDLSEREIADALGISTGSVKTHASRGLATLTSTLEGLR